jgi:hypothetical protein
MEPVPERRKLDRQAAVAQGKVRLSANVWLAVTITDITVQGCKIEATNWPTSPGQAIWLKLESLCSLEAEVRWVLPDHVGIEFKEPLHPAVVDHLLYSSHAEGEDHTMTMLDKFGRELPKLGQRPGSLRSC